MKTSAMMAMVMMAAMMMTCLLKTLLLLMKLLHNSLCFTRSSLCKMVHFCFTLFLVLFLVLLNTLIISALFNYLILNASFFHNLLSSGLYRLVTLFLVPCFSIFCTLFLSQHSFLNRFISLFFLYNFLFFLLLFFVFFHLLHYVGKLFMHLMQYMMLLLFLSLILFNLFTQVIIIELIVVHRVAGLNMAVVLGAMGESLMTFGCRFTFVFFISFIYLIILIREPVV